MDIDQFTDHVCYWMRAFGQNVPDQITNPESNVRLLRNALLREEVDELLNAKTPADVLDAIADILVVAAGAAADAGIDGYTLQAHLHDVLEANDRKRWSVSLRSKIPPGSIVNEAERGLLVVRRPDGKILKPPGWVAPDAQKHIDAQMRREA